MHALLALALAAAPVVEIAPGFEPAGPLTREVQAGWSDLEQAWRGATHAAPPAAPRLLLRRARDLPPDEGGASRLGVMELRQNKDGALTEQMVVELRHELAHQFLFAACPAASDDALFHEAFALSLSGELASWSEGPYLSMAAAKQQLAHAGSLDSRHARQALARLLANSPVQAGVPRVLLAGLRRCADRVRWRPLSVDDLIAIPVAEGDALVVLSRHSGEVLLEDGDARASLPFGSTLKPFLAAGALARGPVLSVDPKRDVWACGDDLPRQMDLPTALLRSCNGYFLDWSARDPSVPRLGAYGPLLQRLGLVHLPQDGSEAIGLRPTLTLTPFALAQAYRALADASPEVLSILRHNAERGTLSGLPSSARLRGIALKTGTVRDADSRVDLGWIAAVDDDVVVVMARRGVQPRDFADELAEVVSRFHGVRANASASVQILGLVPPERVEARCPGVGLAVTPSGPALLDDGMQQLESTAKKGELLCLGAPWLLRFPGGLDAGRAYAGTIRWDVPPPYVPPPYLPAPTERQRRAREGSPFVFTTRLADYVAGVLAAEDSQLAGEPRIALAQAVAHNARASRHPGRPVCDTTHCQAFLGTAPPRAAELEALSDVDRTPPGWLPFSQGGDEPWQESRTLARVAQVLGARPESLSVSNGKVRFTVRRTEGDAVYDDVAELPCERLRNPLHLPACPERVDLVGREVRFAGRGRGHGEGLDVERAKKSALSHGAILREAYGAPAARAE